MSSWLQNKADYRPKREDNALCLGGCGYRLPLYIMAVLRPDQRNHYVRGKCRPCHERDRRKETVNV